MIRFCAVYLFSQSYISNRNQESISKALIIGLISRSFSRNFTSTISIATLLKVVQYYDLGKDYFANRSEIIDNLKLKEINSLASRLFDEKNLFFMIVGKRNM